jgi:hypothetical protein
MDGRRLAHLRWGEDRGADDGTHTPCDLHWLARIRWRRRGAWLWPAFVALTVVDAIIGHAFPPTGETQTLLAAGLSALLLNLIAVVLLSRPVGAVVRARRPDLPVMVARNYAGTMVVALVGLGVLAVGLLHRSTILADRHEERDATVRAQAWIGARAPAPFRRNVQFVDTFAIQPGSMYRSCVPSDDRRRSYCVIVKTKLPFASSVSFAGYEPNSTFAAGAS